MKSLVSAVLLAIVLAASAADAAEWPTANERIVAMLRSPEAAERRSAAAQLLDLPAPRAIESIVPALRDPDVEVRLHAARAAIVLRLPRAGDEVLSWLQESDARLRLAGCDVVRASPSPEGLLALGRVLADSKPEVREAAARALGAVGGPGSVSPLLGRLDDTSPRVRAVVLRALGHLADLRATIPIISKLQDPEPQVRVAAAQALGVLRDPRAAPSLEVALSDRDTEVSLAALEGLGRTGTNDSAAAIAALLEDDGVRAGARTPGSRSVREVGVLALARLGTEDAVRALVRALEREGPVPYEEESAAIVRRALKLVGTRAEAHLLRAIAQSTSSRASSAAALAVAQLVSPASRSRVVEPIVLAARRGTLDIVPAMYALGRLGDRAALPFVVEHFDASDAAVRAVAISVASLLLEPSEPDGRVVDLVRVRLADSGVSASERVALVRLLGRTGAPRAASLLLSVLPPVDPLAQVDPLSLRVAALEALGELGDGSSVVEAALTAQLDHADERVRGAAARALGSVGGDAAAMALLARLVYSAEDDRGVIALALSGVLARASDPRLASSLATAVRAVRSHTRDALLEGAGRSSAPWTLGILEEASKSDDADDRRKVAEALQYRADGEPIARRLLADHDSGVRANAAWSLGNARDPASLPVLRGAIVDRDVAVATNSVTALVRVAGRLGAAADTSQLLCELIDSPRSYVAHAAIRGVVALGVDCGPGRARSLLASSHSAAVRAAAADWLVRVSSGAASTYDDERFADRRALARCVAEERDAAVARRCEASGAASNTNASAGSRDVLVYVVPDGGEHPTPRAPFALVLPEGTIRCGVADRRGAVFVRAVADGALELTIPAPLAP